MERTLQADCIKKAKEFGVLPYKVVAIGQRGFPDLLLIFDGGLVAFVELKTPTGTLSPKQKRVIKRLKAQGAHVYVIYDLKEFTELLEFHH
jgi:hypothetical protein